MEIKVDDLRGAEIAALLAEHLRCMAEFSPPESRHALDLEGLRQPGITFWTAWEGGELLGCGALRELNPQHGEIKSMRTAHGHLRKGVAAQMLAHILSEARRRGYLRLSLETGAFPYFEPARCLYRKFGFEPCGPFQGYREDRNSVFMTQELKGQSTSMNLLPESVVQRQLEAYNARDLDALMQTYAEDAEQFAYPTTLLARGEAEISERFKARFQEPNLHARLIQRLVLGSVVIDQEEVTRTFPEGPGRMELIAIYEVREGRIRTARFISGEKALDPASPA